MYGTPMNAQEHAHYNSHESSITALLDEMPPDDFDNDYGDASQFSITGFLMTAAAFAAGMFMMFT